MSNFTLRDIEWLPEEQEVPFYYLEFDGKCLVEDFFEKMKKSGNQRKSVVKLKSIVITLSEGTKVSTKAFQELRHRSKDDPFPDFEVRANQLRLYVFEDVNEGKIIVLGEVKKGDKTQAKSIAKMREIKLNYFESKK